MSQSVMVVLDCEVLQSRKVTGKNGKANSFFHRALVTDGFGVKETIDVFFLPRVSARSALKK